jgi:hypothetical protein
MQTANLQNWWSSTNVHSTFIFTIYDCSDPVGNLRPKNVVCRNSKFFVKKSQIVNKDSRTTKFIYDLFTRVIDLEGRRYFTYIHEENKLPIVVPQCILDTRGTNYLPGKLMFTRKCLTQECGSLYMNKEHVYSRAKELCIWFVYVHPSGLEKLNT